MLFTQEKCQSPQRQFLLKQHSFPKSLEPVGQGGEGAWAIRKEWMLCQFLPFSSHLFYLEDGLEFTRRDYCILSPQARLIIPQLLQF